MTRKNGQQPQAQVMSTVQMHWHDYTVLLVFKLIWQ